MADHVRGDLLSKRGTQVITDSLTFTGTGGFDVKNGGDIKSGATSIINSTGLLSQNVDGQKVILHWSHENLVTNQTALAIKLPHGATFTEVPIDRAGSIIGCAAYVNAAISAGTIIAMPTVNGTTKMSVSLTTVAQTATGTQDKDTDAFAAGSRIGVKLFSSTNLDAETKDIQVSVTLEI